ncbi:MAG TPA: hypothetical protein VGM98_01725 [Schlesneria sp.]|jgi:hypothetical protein
MDLGAAAEGISEAVFAGVFLGILVIHTMLTMIAVIGLTAAERTRRVIAKCCLLAIVTLYLFLAIRGLFYDVIVDSHPFWWCYFAATSLGVAVTAYCPALPATLRQGKSKT